MTDPDPGLEALHHLYDTAMRLWAESNLHELAQWLDPTVAGLPAAEFQKRSTTFVAPVVSADLLISVGSDRLMHVEYETAPGPDLIGRLYEYRGRIMREHPGKRLTQYVIVLANGTVAGHDDLGTFGFALDVRVVYLRQCSPADFLADPVLAPFAVLARGNRAVREEALGLAIRLLRDGAHPQARVLLQVTEALARLRLPAPVIERIEKEHGMNIQPLVDFYRDTEVGHRLQDLGREEGREEGRERLLLAWLRTKFGEVSEIRPAARRLASWDDAAAALVITQAIDARSLLTVPHPTGNQTNPGIEAQANPGPAGSSSLPT